MQVRRVDRNWDSLECGEEMNPYTSSMTPQRMGGSPPPDGWGSPHFHVQLNATLSFP